MPLDNLLTAIAGAALVTAFLGYATSRLNAHMMITTLACYTSAIGAISLIEAACAWSTGLYRTKIRSRLITRTARSYALFNLAWGIFALGLGVYGLLLA